MVFLGDSRKVLVEILQMLNFFHFLLKSMFRLYSFGFLWILFVFSIGFHLHNVDTLPLREFHSFMIDLMVYLLSFLIGVGPFIWMFFCVFTRIVFYLAELRCVVCIFVVFLIKLLYCEDSLLFCFMKTICCLYVVQHWLRSRIIMCRRSLITL